MARFTKNRQTALILVLASVMLASSMLWTTGIAGGLGPSGGSPEPTTPEGDGNGRGDPDVPTAPARVSVSIVPGARKVSTLTPEARSVGDVRVSAGAWVWRLRIVLQGLKTYTFRF